MYKTANFLKYVIKQVLVNCKSYKLFVLTKVIVTHFPLETLIYLYQFI